MSEHNCTIWTCVLLNFQMTSTQPAVNAYKSYDYRVIRKVSHDISVS